MKLFAKRTLLFTVLVLCMLGVFALAASAETVTAGDDAAAVADGAVARVGAEGSGVYYTSLDEAINTASSNDTVTVLTNTTLSGNITVTDKVLTVQGNATGNDRPVITIGATPFMLEGNTALTVKNVVFAESLNMNFVLINQDGSSGDTVTLTLSGVDGKFTGASGAIIVYGGQSVTATIEDGHFASSHANQSLFRVMTAPTTPISLTVKNITLESTRGQPGDTYALLYDTTTKNAVKLTLGNDATASSLGYIYRVGETAGGKAGEVYFNDKAGAFAACGISGATPYDISSGSAVPVPRLSGTTEFDVNTHLVSMEYEGDIYYYADLAIAIEDACLVEVNTITLLKSFTMSSPVTIKDKTITIKGAASKPTITMASGDSAFLLEGSTTLILENLVFNGFPNTLMAGKDGAAVGKIVIKMTTVDVIFRGGSGTIYFYSGNSAKIDLIDCYFSSDQNGNCILNIASALRDGCDLTLDNVELGGVCGEVNANAEGDIRTTKPDHDNDVFADDAAAKAVGFKFRVGETEGGNANEVYFSDLAQAIQAAPAGSTIYVLGNARVNVGSIPLNKDLKLIGIGLAQGQQHGITYNSATELFLINAGSPANIVMENLLFASTTDKGLWLSIEGAGYANITLKNCSIDFSKRNGIAAQGNAVATITIDGGEYSCTSLFNFEGNVEIELTVKGGAILKGTSVNGDNALIQVNTSATLGDIKINLKDVNILNTRSDKPTIWLKGGSKADIAMENVDINSNSWCISSEKNTVSHVDLTNVTFISAITAPVHMNGADGSVFNVFSGVFESNASAADLEWADDYAIVNFGAQMTVNFYEGFMQSAVASLIAALDDTVTVNIYGGTFSYTNPNGNISPISLPAACTFNVYGGIFRNANRISPVFSNVTDANASLTLHAYHAYGNANLIVNLGNGTPSALHSGFGSSSYNTIVTTIGAKPVLLQNGVGLGFEATVSAKTFQYFQSLALDGNIRFGMLVIATDKLTDGMSFTHYGLSSSGLELGEDFFDIAAFSSNIERLADGSIAIALNYTNIAQADVNTAYSVVFYADMEDAATGVPFYLYSAYDKTENSRSLAQVALCAYNDTSTTQDDFYANAIQDTDLFSPYTADELAALAELCGGNTALKELDIFLVTGGSNAVGNTTYNSNFANSFDLTSLSANVFYSGLIAEPATQTYGKELVPYMASKYTAVGAAPTLDLGWSEGMIGFELGMAQKLSELYNADSGKYAAIIKYAANNATLVGGANDMGNWSNLYDNFLTMVNRQIADYEALGYKVNVVGVYWMQGEQDVAYADDYAAAFETLISKIHTDIADMPVVVGEIATFVNLKTNEANADFVAMQKTLATDKVIVDATSQYMADANGIFNAPNEVVSIGARVAATLVKNGSSSIDPAILNTFQIPEVELVAEIVVEGTPVVSVTSIAMALAMAPENATIKLKVDQTIYNTIELNGISGITLDGNDKTVSVTINDPGFTLKNSAVTFNNFKMLHTGENVGIKVEENSTVIIGGTSDITTNLTAIELTGKNSRLVINGGSFTTTNTMGKGSIIYTSNADVQISGGTFEAAAGTSCVVIDKYSPAKLAVNIEGGSFTTTRATVPNYASDGTVIPGSSKTVRPGAFVNECQVAILVIDPTVTVSEAGPTVNNGVGA